MRVFKTKIEENRAIELTEENYRRETQGKPQFQLIKNNKKMQYALCPACNNPIFIVGLYETNITTHARHCANDVPNLRKVDNFAKENCKYYTGIVHDGADIVNKGALANILYSRMRENFDIAIKFFEKIIGLKISYAFAKDLLKEWINSKGWNYYCCTDSTLVFTFFYGTWEQKIFGRKIKKDSPIYNLLIDKKLKNIVQLEECGNGNFIIKKNDGIQFLYIYCNLNDYKRKTDDFSCVETMTLQVLFRTNPKEEATILKTKIKISSQEWDNFLQKYTSNNWRNEKMLAIAQKCLI